MKKDELYVGCFTKTSLKLKCMIKNNLNQMRWFNRSINAVLKMSQHWNSYKVIIFSWLKKKQEQTGSRTPLIYSELMEHAHASIYLMENNKNNTNKHFVLVVHACFKKEKNKTNPKKLK